MKEGEKLMDRGQLRDAQAAFLTVMDEMPFPVIFKPRLVLEIPTARIPVAVYQALLFSPADHA